MSLMIRDNVPKERRPWRIKPSSAGPAGGPARPESGPASQAGTGEDDVLSRIEALDTKVRRARADADRRHPPTPKERARRAMGVGGVVMLVVGGVTAGLVVTGGSAHGDPIRTYLAAHVAPGTEVGLIGPVGSSLPSGYRGVPVRASDLAAPITLHYAVGPDPITAAGPVVATVVRAHASLLAVEPGRATLWALGRVPPAQAAPGHSPPPSSPSSSLAPVSTAPPSTAPVTPAVAPPTTVPPSPTAPTTAPSVTTTTPTTVAPPVTVAPLPPTTAPATSPAPSGPAASHGTPGPATWVVGLGQSMWSIAAAVEAQRSGATPTVAQISPLWAQLIAANRDRLPIPDNPNLIFPGTILTVPAG